MIDFFSNLFIPGTFRFFLSWIIVVIVVAAFIIVGIILVRIFRRRRKSCKKCCCCGKCRRCRGHGRCHKNNIPGQCLQDSGFCYDEKQDIFFSQMNPWQRNYGYCEMYDEAAPVLSMIIDSEPIRFEYEGKKWLIQLWKGQYGMTTGCEVGVYTTRGLDLNIPKVFDGTFYGDTNEEDHLMIGISLMKGEKELLMRRCKHWWMTGFLLGEFSEPEELTLEVSITMKTEEMRDIFVSTIEEIGYTEDQYKVVGETVFILFEKPYSPRPVTRIAATDKLTQEKNKALCDLYRSVTPEGRSSMEKLAVVARVEPGLYKSILQFFRSKKRYAGYRKIQKHVK